jgi:hypothetical protein
MKLKPNDISITSQLFSNYFTKYTLYIDTFTFATIASGLILTNYLENNNDNYNDNILISISKSITPFSSMMLGIAFMSFYSEFYGIKNIINNNKNIGFFTGLFWNVPVFCNNGMILDSLIYGVFAYLLMMIEQFTKQPYIFFLNYEPKYNVVPAFYMGISLITFIHGIIIVKNTIYLQ